MSLSTYIEIVKPKYTVLKITPHTSTRNYHNSNIAKMISTMYRSITKSIEKKERGYFVKTPMKCSYVIDIYKEDICFYFVVPELYKSIAKRKIASTWNKATIQEVKHIPNLNSTDSITLYQLKYAKMDAFSLDIDTKSNYPLNHVLDVVEIMEKNDRVTVLYNFQPCSQYGWSAKCDKAHEKYRNNMVVTKEKDVKYMVFTALYAVVDFLDRFISKLTNSTLEEINPISELSSVLKENDRKMSALTKKKRYETVLNTQIAVVSSSNNAVRSQSNAIAVCHSFQTIQGDNELIYEKVNNKHNIDIENYKLKGIENNKVSVSECHNFIQLPGRDLLLEHKIGHVNVLENEVPKPLRKGVMKLGDSIVRGFKQEAYISTDKSFKYLTLCLIGSTRAGKTTLISNLCRDSSIANETNIIFDWCGNCELSNSVIKTVKKQGGKVLEIDCSDVNKLQGLGYNELWVNDNIYTNNIAFEKYRSAKQQSTQLLTLINANQKSDEGLRARMERYLGAASLVVFVQNGSIRDVFNVLQNHQIRHQYINTIPSNQKENLEEYVSHLKELDEKNKEGAIAGTKLSAVQGILNRVTKLKQNAYMEMMLKKDCKENFNLVEEMQRGQLICIKMSEDMFATEQEKDTYATYWLTKVWGALQQRKWLYRDKEKDMIKVNMYFDELYQVESCQEFLRSKLSQIAKFKAKPIISCHYLGQIGIIRNELKSANSSYMLISGSDKDNYKELKEELEPYTLEDLLNLKRYHALCLMKYEGGWGKFIVKMPKPLI